ncbi:MAG: DUF559 domain-containing protein [Acidimicrobiales bacterium]
MSWRNSASRQLGLVTMKQLADSCVSRSQRRTLLANGALVPVHRTVFRLAGAPVTVEQRRLAAVLATDHAVLSHGAAAGVWGAERLAGAPPEILVPVDRSTRLPGVVVHRTRDLSRSDVVSYRHHPRITRPARTVLDLAELDIDDNVLEEVGAELLLAFPRELVRLGGSLAHHRGRATGRLERLFGEYLDSGRRPPHPGLERRLLEIVRGSDVPRPVVHLRIDTPAGCIEVDLAWPSAQLAVEADSARWHSSPAALRTDRSRDQALAMVGWAVARFTWDQVRSHPQDVINIITGILAYRVA